MRDLDGRLGPNSDEVRLALQFQKQQMTSLVLPNEARFILWLTLQDPSFFAAGRTDQQRLSAARIGERMLLSGVSQATPTTGMWALVCNEVGVSYDQEEKIRTYQRSVLNDKKAWVDRHQMGGIGRTVEGLYERMKGAGKMVEDAIEPEKKVLSLEQRIKLAKYCEDNSDRISKAFGQTEESKKADLDALLAEMNSVPHER